MQVERHGHIAPRGGMSCLIQINETAASSRALRGHPPARWFQPCWFQQRKAPARGPRLAMQLAYIRRTNRRFVT